MYGDVGDNKVIQLDLGGEFPQLIVRVVQRKLFNINPKKKHLKATESILYRDSLRGKEKWRYDLDEDKYM